MGWLDLSPREEVPSSSEPIEITEAPQTPPPTAQAEKTESAQPVPKVRAKEKEIVETEDANNRKIDPNAKFLSEHNQSAEKEMRAKTVDDFREKQGKGLKTEKPSPHDLLPPTATNEPKTDEQAEPQPEGEGAVSPKKKVTAQTKGVKRDWKTLSLKDLSVGADNAPAAASDDRASGVDEGDRTILSTREFKFFSYYRRIKELLRQYWKPMVEAKLYKLWSKGQQVSQDELTTQLLVLLDEHGTIQKISRVGSSGVSELDDAAIEAFHRAAPFPNPPKGMVDADGFVRIRWDFILKAEAGPMIQFRNVGSAAPY
jgi:protein TonB